MTSRTMEMGFMGPPFSTVDSNVEEENAEQSGLFLFQTNSLLHFLLGNGSCHPWHIFFHHRWRNGEPWPSSRESSRKLSHTH